MSVIHAAQSGGEAVARNISHSAALDGLVYSAIPGEIVAYTEPNGNVVSKLTVTGSETGTVIPSRFSGSTSLWVMPNEDVVVDIKFAPSP